MSSKLIQLFMLRPPAAHYYALQTFGKTNLPPTVNMNKRILPHVNINHSNRSFRISAKGRKYDKVAKYFCFLCYPNSVRMLLASLWFIVNKSYLHVSDLDRETPSLSSLIESDHITDIIIRFLEITICLLFWK